MFVKRLVLAVCAVGLTACASGPERPKPTPLADLAPSSVSVRVAWTAQMGGPVGGLRARVASGQVALANLKGLVQVREVATGALVWESSLPKGISAGLGFDGQRVAVVDVDNQLTVIQKGQVIWRHRLNARTFTPPFLAGGRIFVVTADREVQAFDADNGAVLWNHSYTGEPLVLQAPTVLGAFGPDLVVGLGENFVAIRPDSGEAFWSAALARPRGANEIERLSDVVAGAHSANGLLCGRAFQASVACVAIQSGARVWSHDDDGSTGISGDDQRVFASDRTGRLKAWSLTDGKLLWQQDSLRFRDLSTSTPLGRTLVVGDAQGFVHWIAKDDGKILARMPTDGSAITSPPQLFNDTLIALTANGGVFAWQPQ
ncbi:MAG: outer membrane protein assembly factor BamB [Pseudomonadota bacterium]